MTLSFSTIINGKPNYFIEKIWNGLLYGNHGEYHYSYNVFLEDYRKNFKNDWDGHPDNNLAPKLHTIRLDEKSRWGAGCDIHFVINNRTPNRFQFAPVIKCVSVQEIKITHYAGSEIKGAMIGPFTSVQIDGKILRYDVISQLAINDGFDSVEDFFAYFNKDFTGKIIHWTDLKY